MKSNATFYRALISLSHPISIGAILFMLPYILWSQGGIPFYMTVMSFALLLAGVALIAGRFYLRGFRNAPPLPTNDPNMPASA